MMMIIFSLVKIITTHEYTQKKFYSLKPLSVATFATHCDSYIQETTSNLPAVHVSSYTHTHTNNHLFDHTQ